MGSGFSAPGAGQRGGRQELPFCRDGFLAGLEVQADVREHDALELGGWLSALHAISVFEDFACMFIVLSWHAAWAVARVRASVQEFGAAVELGVGNYKSKAIVVTRQNLFVERVVLAFELFSEHVRSCAASRHLQ